MESKKNKGITLIALVITIIIMLILAGITMSLTLGEHGIFKTAKGAMSNYTNAQNKEVIDLANLEEEINRLTTGPNIKIEQIIVNVSGKDFIMLRASLDGYDANNIREISYEEYAREILEGKNEAEKEQIFMEGEKYWYWDEMTEEALNCTDFKEYISLRYGIQVNDLQDVIEYEFQVYARDDVDGLLISHRYVYPNLYDFHCDYAKEIVFTNPEGENIALYIPLSDGEYTFKAETIDGKKLAKTISIDVYYQDVNDGTYTLGSDGDLLDGNGQGVLFSEAYMLLKDGLVDMSPYIKTMDSYSMVNRGRCVW